MFRPIFTGFITLLLLAAAPLWASQKRELSREFAVSGSPTLDFELSAGDLEFLPGPEGRVVIEIVQTVGQSDAMSAAKAFDAWAFEFSAQHNTVRFQGGSRRNLIWDWDPVRQVQCAVRVTAPLSSTIRLRGTQVRASIERIDGDLTAGIDGGRLFAGRVGGDVEVKSLTAQVVLSSVAGRTRVGLQTGQVLIGTAEGPVEVNSNGGLVEIQQAVDQVDIRGDTLEVVLGLANPLRGDATVKTAVGSITLKVEHTANVCLDAAAPWLGEVKARGLDLDVRSGRPGSSRLRAVLNDGGPRVRLRASGGTVSIIGVEPLATLALAP